MMPKDPMPRKRGSTEIRSGALLLPALLRSDWQPSSSQLPIILNDARRTSSPGGRYCLRRAHGDARQSAASSLKSPSPAQDLRTPPERVFHPMRIAHGCHSEPALQARAGPAYMKAIGRATISSSQRPRQDWRPLLLPGCRSTSAKPAGPPPRRALFFCAAPKASAHSAFTFVAVRTVFRQNFAEIFT